MAPQLLTSNAMSTFSGLSDSYQGPGVCQHQHSSAMASFALPLHSMPTSTRPFTCVLGPHNTREVGRTDDCQFPRQMKALSYRTVRGLLEEVMGRRRSGLPCTWPLPSYCLLQYFASFLVNSSGPSILFPYFGYSVHQGFQNTSNLTPLLFLSISPISNRCPSTYVTIRSIWHRSKSPQSTSLSPPPRILISISFIWLQQIVIFPRHGLKHETTYTYISTSMKETHVSNDVQYDAQKSHQHTNKHQYYRGVLKYNCKQYFKHTLIAAD